MKFIAHWYNQDELIATDSEIIEAENAEDATSKAFMKHNGHPPAPLLWLESV